MTGDTGRPEFPDHPGANAAGAQKAANERGEPKVTTQTNLVSLLGFILSVVWVAGLASIGAIVLGVRGRREVLDSNGDQTGLQLANWAIGLGIAGVMAAVVFWTFVLSAGNVISQLQSPSGSPGLKPLGSTYSVPLTSLSGGVDNGITQVTVRWFSFPVTSKVPLVQAGHGKAFAVADITVCAGGDGSPSGPNFFLFELDLSHGTTVRTAVVNAVDPSLELIGPMSPYQCGSGYLTFKVPSASQPSGIIYQADFSHSYEWAVK